MSEASEALYQKFRHSNNRWQLLSEMLTRKPAKTVETQKNQKTTKK